MNLIGSLVGMTCPVSGRQRNYPYLAPPALEMALLPCCLDAVYDCLPFLFGPPAQITADKAEITYVSVRRLQMGLLGSYQKQRLGYELYFLQTGGPSPMRHHSLILTQG